MYDFRVCFVLQKEIYLKKSSICFNITTNISSTNILLTATVAPYGISLNRYVKVVFRPYLIPN